MTRLEEAIVQKIIEVRDKPQERNVLSENLYLSFQVGLFSRAEIGALLIVAAARLRRENAEKSDFRREC